MLEKVDNSQLKEYYKDELNASKFVKSHLRYVL